MNKTLLEYLDHWKTEYPNEVWMRYPQGDNVQEWSWLKASEQIHAIAAWQQTVLGEAGVNVGLLSRNRPHWFMADLGTIAAGNVTVPMFTTLPKDTAAYVMEFTDMQLLFVGENENWDKISTVLPKGLTLVALPGVELDCEHLRWDDIINDYRGQRATYQAQPTDLVSIVFTSGTTGMPKGVMWEHHNLRETQTMALRALGEVPETLDELKASLKETGPGQVYIPACPLMHGTGLFTAMGVLMNGGTIVTLEAASLNSSELWSTVERRGVEYMAIVGDAFAKPMLQELKDNPGTYDVSSVASIVSSGVMWSMEVKQEMLEYLPDECMLADSFGSSEAIGFGSSITMKDMPVKTAKFTTNEMCKVFDENDEEIPWGSETPGFIAFGGPIPLGYYKDEEKTAKTFKTINGHRYSIPGDYCLVSPEGELTLLGRGSVCINSAGEKIYPEEVEEALKLHDAIDDALVVGVPDEKWGQAVTAVVKTVEGNAFDEAELKLFCKGKLAAYKTPKHVFHGGPPFRAPNGKADYKSVTEFALAEIEKRA